MLENIFIDFTEQDFREFSARIQKEIPLMLEIIKAIEKNIPDHSRRIFIAEQILKHFEVSN